MNDFNDVLIFAEGLLYGVITFYCITSIIISILINIKGYYYFSIFLLSGVAYNLVKSENIRYGFDYFNIEIYEMAEHYLMIFYLFSLLLFIWYYLNNRYNIPKYTERILQFLALIIFLLFLINILIDLYPSINSIGFSNQLNGWIFQVINLAIGLILLLQYPKLKDKQMLLFTIVYFGIFSILFFNPSNNISTFFSKWVSDYFLYSGGLLIGIILMLITILRAFYIRQNSSKITREIKDTHLAYAYSIIQGRQDERRRFAEELHDHIGILLTTLKFNSLATFSDDKERQYFNRNIDLLCKKVRDESHELLPPTLTKLGIDKAFTYYKEQKNNTTETLTLKWNFTGKQLSSTTEYVLYYILTHTLDYIYAQKVEGKIQCVIMVFDVAKFIKIKITYSGLAFDKNHPMLKNTKSLLQLMNGTFSSSIKNIWDNQVDIEIPYIA